MLKLLKPLKNINLIFFKLKILLKNTKKNKNRYKKKRKR
jgi:hypothetical protein